MQRMISSLRESGQILVGAILLLVLLAVMVPVMVLYTQREARWTQKQDQSTTAFHLAESGVEKGYRKLSLSTAAWYGLIESGTPIDRFKFDYVFADIAGGTYVVSITSGPEDRQATVISVGKDRRGKETRALRVVYAQNILGDTAIQAMGGTTIQGADAQVHWGAVISPEQIDSLGRTSPQFWSAGGILPYDTDPAPPNCDQPNCWQWFSYSQDVPPDPGIDLNFYRSSAQATTAGCPPGGVDYGSGASCYYSGDYTIPANTDYAGGSTIFIEGDLDIGGRIRVIGNLIVTGDCNPPNGNWGDNSPFPMVMNQTAWKQYGNNWAGYNFGDGTKPANFPGLDSDYLSPLGLTYVVSKVPVAGFFYIGGNFGPGGGGGNTNIYGIMLIQGNATFAQNNIMVYYNDEASANIRSLRLVLVRKSWQGERMGWPL